MRRRGTGVALLALGALAAGLLWASLAAAGRSVYHVEAVTIKVDRGARMLSGEVIADAAAWHVCTLDQWPVTVRLAGSGRKVVHTRTSYSGKWKVRIRPTSLRGKRVYAEVPSFTTRLANCVGKRSRTVRAP